MSAYQKITKKLVKVTIRNPKTNTSLDWINGTNAGKEEIEYLRKNFKFELNHLKASMGKSMSQRPLVEMGKGYLFVILHFPVYSGEKIIAEEVDFFVGKKYLVTLHNNNIPTLTDFFNFCKKEPNCLISFEHDTPTILLYQLLERMFLSCFPVLDQNSLAINAVEERLFSQPNEKVTVAKIMQLRRNMVNLRKIMQNHKTILKKLMEAEYTLLSEEDVKRFFRKLVDYSKRIWEVIESQKEMTEIFNDTNQSLMRNRLSEVMKTLTIFSVLTFPLTLFATIFSMNMSNGMPFLDAPNNFWIIIQFLVVIALSMLLYFEKKGWL